jgi:hypothetical protein
MFDRSFVALHAVRPHNPWRSIGTVVTTLDLTNHSYVRTAMFSRRRMHPAPT